MKVEASAAQRDLGPATGGGGRPLPARIITFSAGGPQFPADARLANRLDSANGVQGSE